MQPESDKPEWQPPVQQPSQAPYVAPSQETPVRAPVVTLTPDTAPSVPIWQAASAASPQPTEVTDEPLQESAQPEEEPIRWQGTEYIHHEKDMVWFVLFAVVIVVLMSISIFFIQSITFTILIPVMAAALLVYTRRPPRINEYTLSRQGLHINDQLYPFSEFRAFGVIRDDLEYSVMLLPTKRFNLGVSIYFPEEAGEAIVDALGARLPMQEQHLDAFDKIIHKLRI
jgi:hypothetical protein